MPVTLPGLQHLVVGRGAAAGFAAALLPTSLVYVGDRVPFGRRQQVIANVLAAGALGTVGATVGAGLLGRYLGWRVVFLVPAILALVDAYLLGRLAESLPSTARAGPFTQIRRVMAHPWAIFVIVLALGEGAAMLGFLTFLAPALQTNGVSSAAAGLVVAMQLGRRTCAVREIVPRVFVNPRSCVSVLTSHDAIVEDREARPRTAIRAGQDRRTAGPHLW